MKNKTVSIVVPVYNVKKYLDKCLKSIINQSYKNLEIILVDDGSTDGSSIICDEWEVKENRIKVIHKENGGLSDARNVGIEFANGKYIMFEDSDDWLDLNIIEKCVDRIEQDNSDLVIFGYTKIDEKGNILDTLTFGDGTFTNEDMSGQLHKRILEMSYGYAWNKLYKLSIIKKTGIVNDSNIIDREDLYFNLQLFNHLKRISYIDQVGYYYLQRNTSLLHNSDLARLKGIKVFCDRMHQINLNNEKDERKVFNMNILHYLSDCIIKNIISNKEITKSERNKLLREIVKDIRYKDELFLDKDNPRYLNILYDGIKNNSLRRFYRYVKLSLIKSKIVR